MSKIIITNVEKTEFEAHQVLNCEVDFSVIEKSSDKFHITANTDKGLVTIELSKEEIKLLLGRIQEKL